jgi:aarF domain-containing kinase
VKSEGKTDEKVIKMVKPGDYKVDAGKGNRLYDQAVK